MNSIVAQLQICSRGMQDYLFFSSSVWALNECECNKQADEFRVTGEEKTLLNPCLFVPQFKVSCQSDALLSSSHIKTGED